MPPTVPINHYVNITKPTKIDTTSFSIIPCTNIQACEACFEHSNFFKVNLLALNDNRLRSPPSLQQMTQPNGEVASNNEPPPGCRDPTTSFLTATTLIYAIGAGITAAAGTRLALQWVLVKGFKVYSFRLPSLG